MKKVLLFISLIPMISFSQKKDVLKYFISKDSLVGVKNKDGKIIVPAQFRIFSNIENGELVEGETIYFDGFKKDEEKEKNAWGYVYDKKGNFLYRPFLYDSGADYFEEGVRRFVKNGKVGFAGRNGKTVIEAKYDFVSPFNYGYAAFCDGCDWGKTEEEHKAIVGGTWGVMNFKGEIIQPISKSENAVEINGKYYPYPFKYNEKEKSILQFFEKQNKQLSDIYYVNHYNKLSENEKKLLFEIVERPKENFPFYQVNTYDYRKMEAGISNFKFLVSENGKNVLALEFDNEKIPFEKWLKDEMKEAEEFQKEHPDNPNKLSK
ncbi:WG repeat-containing protein [Chryseobacterium limigenitum]|uniref:WG containing repeat-containing protein n=1 Tax=Chryseobacterium limigenitum TaxID=1612149 RepID=A0A1K2ITX8_9FLAO|nr:WG repeat-containing protein [Chryseobacterium limigenitum]SFZ95640.1 WG containing repeat-containing protein [Chryseobacterium limigenitum]